MVLKLHNNTLSLDTTLPASLAQHVEEVDCYKGDKVKVSLRAKFCAFDNTTCLLTIFVLIHHVTFSTDTIPDKSRGQEESTKTSGKINPGEYRIIS